MGSRATSSGGPLITDIFPNFGRRSSGTQDPAPPPLQDTTTVLGPKLDDLTVSVASYGQPIPIVYGRRRVSTNVIWSTDIKENRNATSINQSTPGGKGGKGGGKKKFDGAGSSATATTISYSVSFAASICEGPVVDVLRIWANNELIMDKTVLENPPVGTKFVGKITTYTGTETQGIDPTYEADVGVGNAPAHRGMAYLVFNNIPLEDFGNRIPSISVEVSTAVSSALPVVGPVLGAPSMQAGVYNISRTGMYTISSGFQGARVSYLSQSVVFKKTLADDNALSSPQASIGVVDNPQLDILGNFYVGVGTTSNPVILAYDGETFELIAGTEVGYATGTIEKITVCGPLRDQRIFAVGINGVCSIVKTAPYERAGIIAPTKFRILSGATGTIPLMEKTAEFDLNDIFPPDESAYDFFNDGGITRDGEGFVWMVCNDGALNTTYITKVDPSAGMPLAQWKMKNTDAEFHTNFATTDVDVAADTIFMEDHGFRTGDGPWGFSTTGTLPAGLAVSTDYYLRRIDNDKFALHITIDAARAATGTIDITDVGTGTHTLDHGFQGVGEVGDNLVTWDSVSNSIIWVQGGAGFDGTGVLRSFSIDFGLEGAVKRQLENSTDGTGDNETQFNNHPINGRLWLTSGGNGRSEINTAEMLLVRQVSATDWTSGVFDQMTYDPINNALVELDGGTPALYWHFLDRATGATLTLRSIVEDVCFRVGFNIANDIDATNLTDAVIGYVITNRMPARSALAPLAQLYFFDGIESDWKIKFIKRGGASIVDIPEGKLAARKGGGKTQIPRIHGTRQQELELLAQIDISYQDPTFSYQTMTQTAKRVADAVDTIRSQSLSMPVVIDNSEARQRAEVMLYSNWFERNRYTITVGPEFIGLDVGDLISTTIDSVPYIIRIQQISLGADFIVRISGVGSSGLTIAEAEAAENALYSFTAIPGSGAAGFTQPTVVIIGASPYAVMDINLLNDFHDDLGMYLAAGQEGDLSWPGASFIVSPDLETFARFDHVPRDRNSDIGFCTTVLPAPVTSFATWDEVSTVNVKMYKGTLTSDTRANVLSGANALVIGLEIVQFVTAVLEADGTYTLSDLLRARRGTDPFMVHAIGDRVVVIDPSTLVRAPLSIDELLQTRHYKAITVGGNPLEGFIRTTTFVGNSLKPYTVQKVTGAIDTPATDDWTISWRRRTRIGGVWHDGADVPVGERDLVFEVDVMADGTEAAAVKRIITATASGNGTVVNPDADPPNAVYDAADQSTDFGGVQTTLFLRIYQMSEIVGRGHRRDVTITE